MTLYKPSKFELWWSDTGRSRSLPAAFLFTDSSNTLQVCEGWGVPGAKAGGGGSQPWSDVGRSRSLPAALLFTDSSHTLQVSAGEVGVGRGLGAKARARVRGGGT